jgi:serine/threonine protein kinase/CheY-like chemotaxis protein
LINLVNENQRDRLSRNMARILIVDDDTDLSRSLSQFFKKRDHHTETADCATAAFDILNENDFDLLILDWELPDASGLDICKAYRSHGGLGGVIMLTGRTGSMEKVSGLNAGADDYQTKPFSMVEFGARVNSLLRRLNMAKPVEPAVLDESIVGQTFANSYQIDAVLGKGGMGLVYKATHKTLDRVVAIKVLSGENISASSRKRFELEAKAMSLLDHPNLIKIYEFGLVNESTPYIVMEYVEGVSLKQLTNRHGALPMQAMLPVFIQICDALEHAHSQSIIHRDLKPTNVMISSNNCQAKLLDLGIVKFLNSGSQDIQLTLADQIFGSPIYMSPEQATNAPLDFRTDIYSMACLMFEVLSGKYAYPGETFAEVLEAKLSNKAPKLTQRAPEIACPLDLEALILRMLEKSPANRPQSLAEVKQVLEKIQVETASSHNARTLSELLKARNKFS